jgi:hypothetical protein
VIAVGDQRFVGPPCDGLPEEREHALREQRGRLVVVHGEIVLAAGMNDEVRSGHGRGEPLRELGSSSWPLGSTPIQCGSQPS